MLELSTYQGLSEDREQAAVYIIDASYQQEASLLVASLCFVNRHISDARQTIVDIATGEKITIVLTPEMLNLQMPAYWVKETLEVVS